MTRASDRAAEVQAGDCIIVGGKAVLVTDTAHRVKGRVFIGWKRTTSSGLLDRGNDDPVKSVYRKPRKS